MNICYISNIRYLSKYVMDDNFDFRWESNLCFISLNLHLINPARFLRSTFYKHVYFRISDSNKFYGWVSEKANLHPRKISFCKDV